MNLIAPPTNSPFEAAVEPDLELGAYEALWLQQGATFKKIADRFRNDPTALPSDFVSRSEAMECFKKILEIFEKKELHAFGVRLNQTLNYPPRLREARHPLELLYFRGLWELMDSKSIAVVGSRKASDAGKARARRLAHGLVERGYTVVSGLALGIDSAALDAAMGCGGRVVGVIGTPICDYYPKESRSLQEKIATEHLLISQVPVLRYYEQHWASNRIFFPERNATMSAISQATIIVEASDTSGTLVQAREALHQKRKLFILNSCFERDDISWPERFLKQGAIRVRDFSDIWKHL
ncbi:DNA-processing protein DprA [Kordiimonas sp.]|uniref:DNA-processing protein DprA n=1 Tax=Kordiimonas sp. TaxID=1970157 RepID=UPI003A913682